jgi:hypothetical protein
LGAQIKAHTPTPIRALLYISISPKQLPNKFVVSRWGVILKVVCNTHQTRLENGAGDEEVLSFILNNSTCGNLLGLLR